jgi:hypothetical protein
MRFNPVECGAAVGVACKMTSPPLGAFQIDRKLVASGALCWAPRGRKGARLILRTGDRLSVYVLSAIVIVYIADFGNGWPVTGKNWIMMYGAKGDGTCLVEIQDGQGRRAGDFNPHSEAAQ